MRASNKNHIIAYLGQIAVILICFNFSVVSGENSGLRFITINTNDGLSNNIITSIAQDNQGYMWFGTMEGLNRFDGFNNTIFEKKLGDSTSLSNNMIYSLRIDYKGSFWVGTQTGLCLYNSDSENFKTYVLDKFRPNINTANRVTGIEEDSENNFYVVSEIGTLYIYESETDRFIGDEHDFRSIKDFIIDSEDHFWFGGIFGLYFYNKEEDEVIHYESFVENGKEYPIHEVNTLYEEGDTIWVGTTKGKILYLLKEDMQLRVLDYDFEQTYFIYDVFKDSKDLIYFCTTNGLFIFNKTTNDYTQYKYDKNNRFGVNSIGITKVFEDVQGNIWVGTYQGGINLAVSGKAFNNYNLYSKGISMDIDNISAIEEDSKGNLWLGSFNLGVNRINLKTGERKLYLPDPDDPATLGHGSVFTIFEDSKQNIWVGAYLGYLQKLNQKTGQFISYPISPELGNESKGLDIRSIDEDKDGNLWLVIHGIGIARFNPETCEFKIFHRDYNSQEPTLADDWAVQLLIDHNGIIWVATPSGLSCFDPETEKFKNYFHSDKDTSSICNSFITLLFEDSNLNLWVGTAFGLNFYDDEKDSFVPFYEEDGLPSNQIKSMLEHKPGELWISTAYGLSRMRYGIDSVTGTMNADFRNYDQYDNIQDIFFWERSACKTQDDQLIFGCEKGIVMFNPDEIKDNERTPEVYITGLKLFNKPVNVGDPSGILNKNISQTSEICLNYDQNIISFEFVAINYIANEKNQYAYKLQGFDSDWMKIGNKREATYTNLDPGTYLFQVKASNNDGYWNETGTSIKLIISPPFWATWWFRIIALIGIVSLVISFYLFRINILKNQNIDLEKRVQSRTRELSELNAELVEKHNRILLQNEEILEQNKEIFNKTEEIGVQKELLEEQKSKVEKAYEELSQYRNKLEDLVDERTKELIYAKERAEEADELKSSFLANLSHEIRTPLNSIIGFTGLFFDSEVSEEERKTFKSIIDSSSNTLLNLINDIIDFSKIEAKHLDIHIDDVFINSIFNELEKIYNLELKRQQTSDQKNIEFRLSIDKKIRSLVIKTDEIRLKQILSNLINNAIKFTDKGYIEVGCKMSESESNMLHIFVKDTGIGIQPKDQKIIFQRFRKIEDDREYLYRGAGLGLTICQHLVELLGGKIWVESTPDSGSIFQFSIPLDHSTKMEVLDTYIPDNQELPDLSKKTILIVEDDYSNYSYLLRVLLKANATIMHALNGRQGVDMFKDNPGIDMILMDIKMPVMNGIEALKELQQMKIKIPVIAQTAYAFSDEIRKIRDVGFNDFISKPIAAADLYSMISKHMKS